MDELENEGLENEEELQEDANLEDDSSGEVEHEEATYDDDSGYDEDVVEEGEVEEDDTPEEPIDHTYKFNGETYEFNDQLKALADTPEKADLVRELVQQADYVEQSKDHRQYLKSENDQLRYTEAQRQQAVQQMMGMVQNKDLRSFHNAWNISEEDILAEADRILQVRNMDPQDRARYEQGIQANEHNWALQNQLQQQQQYINQMAMQQRDYEINQVLQSPEVAQAAYDYDQRVGQGAFRAEMIRRGQMHAITSKRDVPPAELAREILSFLPPQPQRQGAHGGQSQQSRVVTQQKPTLPKVKGRGGSPVKSTVNYISDLRKLANQANS